MKHLRKLKRIYQNLEKASKTHAHRKRARNGIKKIDGLIKKARAKSKKSRR